MKNDRTEKEEKQFEQDINELVKKIKTSATVLKLALPLAVILSFFNLIPFYVIFLVVIAAASIAGMLIYKYLRCPRCQTSPLNFAGFEAHPFCQKCGLRLDDSKTIQEKVVEKYRDAKAGEIDWTPLNTSTSGSDRYRLVKTKKGELSFQPTWGLQLFGGVFALAGIGIAYAMFRDIPPGTELFSAQNLILLLPLLFTIGGGMIIYYAREQRLFSLSDGVFKKGRNAPILLIRVSALQLLSHNVSDSEGADYLSYQLNLVLHDKTREHVVSYADKDNAIRNSERLASYLGVKLWNGI